MEGAEQRPGAQLGCHRAHLLPQSRRTDERPSRNEPSGGERSRPSHLALRREQQVGVEAAVIAGVAAPPDLVDLEQHGVAVAVQPHRVHVLGVARTSDP